VALALGSGRRPSSPRGVAAVYMVVLFMSLLDLTVVSVAAPAVGRDLSISPAGLGGLTVAYVVALAAVSPITAWLGGRFGGKRTLLAAVALFTAASAVCGCAAGYGELIGGRVLQGVGAGAFMPIGFAMLYRAYPPPERLRVTTWTALISGSVPILGPVVAGLAITVASWRVVFLLNVPVGVLALVLGLVVLRGEQDQTYRSPLDLVGVVLVVPGLSGLMAALSLGPTVGWGSLPILVLAAAGIALLTAFVLRAPRVPTPLLELALLRSGRFSRAVLVTVFANAAFFGFLFVGGLYLQQSAGLTAGEAGLVFLAGGLPGLPGAQLTSRVLIPRLGTRPVIAGGLIGLAGGLGAYALVQAHAAIWQDVLLFFLIGASWSIVFIPLSLTAFAEIAPARTGQASTIYQGSRQVATALGVAAASSALGLGTVGETAFGWSFAVLGAGAVAAALGTIRLPGT
jgi:EmrB/QacA subfamily drug resistance transporter